VLGGPRISELCLLDSTDVDLAAQAIRIPRVKTDASERVVPMVAALHEILLANRAERPSAGRGVSGLKPESAEKPPKRTGLATARSAEKTRKGRAFLRAADGIRTHDLLHGKQNAGEGSRPQVACKHDVTPNCGSLRTE
jgi:integrase